MQYMTTWKDGHIHSVVEPDSELHVACIDTRFKDFPTIRQAKLWITARSRLPKPQPMRTEDWRQVTPVHSGKNPVLEFHSADGRYLYTSTWYKSVAHAWAFVNPLAKPAVDRISVKRS